MSIANVCLGAATIPTYSQTFEITYASPADAAAAVLKPLPVLDGKPWALSARWDDNHPGNLEMHKVMARHGLKGTFYLNQTDARGRYGAKYVKELMTDDFTIGDHTQTHPFLTSLSPNTLFYEVLANRVEREAQADKPIVSFAFPFGLWNSKFDPNVATRITDVLRRSGLNHCVYHTFAFAHSNPNVSPYEFSTCLLVPPGDHVVDAEKFFNRLGRILKFPKAYRKISSCITLATHARQRGKEWDKLDKLFTKLVAEHGDWWFCNANEYAAYAQQYHHAKIERLAVRGAVVTYRITRALPADAGADVPLTVAIEHAKAVKITGKNAKDTLQTHDGRTLVNLANDPGRLPPSRIDAIDNPDNAPLDSAKDQSSDFPGVAMWLTMDRAANRLTLHIENHSKRTMRDIRVTLRLPLMYADGVRRDALPELPAGQQRDHHFALGQPSDDVALLDGPWYFVAQVDFHVDGKAARLYATTRVPAQAATVSCVRDAAAMAGPLAPADIQPDVLQRLSRPDAKLTSLNTSPTGRWFSATSADRQRFARDALTLYRPDADWVEATKPFSRKDHRFLASLDFSLDEATPLTIHSEMPVALAYLDGRPVKADQPITVGKGEHRLMLVLAIADKRIYWKPRPVALRIVPKSGTVRYHAADTSAARKQTAATTTAAPVDDAHWAPFVIPTDVSAKSLIAFPKHRQGIGIDSPHVTARDGHFYVGTRRLRLWGVNMAFGANFPTHADARRIARRLEAFGVNSVRFHHMDAYYFHFPNSIWDAKDRTTLSAQALDRLDYFIDQLAQHGIYSDLNLHVSALHSRDLKLPSSKATGPYDKIVDIFTPALIAAQKQYARELLTHVNAYRQVSYARDPAVAFVEINNEDSLFMWGAPRKLADMDPYYAKILQAQYNTWLKQRYGSTDKLAAAWRDASDAGRGRPSATPLPLTGNDGHWSMSQQNGAKATVQPLDQGDGVRIAVQHLGPNVWNLEYHWSGIALSKDNYDTLTFRARADEPRVVIINAKQAHAPWRTLDLRQNIKLTAQWRTFTVKFHPTSDEPNGRISFMLGQSKVPFELADVNLVAGPPRGLADDEKLDNASVRIMAAGVSNARLADRLRFLAQTERAYYSGFRTFLRKDLGCRSLITGTIAFGYLGLWAQSDMDYIDTHSYWQHPQFPAGWSATNWTIDQKALADDWAGSGLFESMAVRLAGKPLTVSEYNHPAPNDYQAECVPVIAGIAAAQDWDGVWLFDYAGDNKRWDKQAFHGFFNIQHNPSKWGMMPIGAVMFRDAGVEPLAKGHVYSLSQGNDVLSDLVGLHVAYGGDASRTLAKRYNLTRAEMLKHRIEVSWSGSDRDLPTSASVTELDFDRGLVRIRGRSAFADIQTKQASAPRWTDKPAFVVLAGAALDGKSLSDSGKVLFAICGRCENTGMVFSKGRRTVGKHWGHAPVRIETVDAHLPWPMAHTGQWTALSPLGTPKHTVSLDARHNPLILRFTPDRQTMWYLLAR